MGGEQVNPDSDTVRVFIEGVELREGIRPEIAEGEIFADPDSAAMFIGAIVEVAEVDAHVVTSDAKFGDKIPGDSLTVLEILEIVQESADTDLPTEAFDGSITAGDAYVIARRLIEARRQKRGDGPEAGDREPREPQPSAPTGSVAVDLPK